MYEKQVGWVVLEHNEWKQVHEFGGSYMKSVMVWKLSGCNRAYVSELKLQFPGRQVNWSKDQDGADDWR
ncbi:hypothetical protein QL285_046237 [Trifolium repens]|nr:hypothetical protein QL285_046236 [Trifolium repens]KAK2410904.1 hypothetical protein QL285_046237 [Trifolium repens]